MGISRETTQFHLVSRRRDRGVVPTLLPLSLNTSTDPPSSPGGINSSLSGRVSSLLLSMSYLVMNELLAGWMQTVHHCDLFCNSPWHAEQPSWYPRDACITLTCYVAEQIRKELNCVVRDKHERHSAKPP